MFTEKDIKPETYPKAFEYVKKLHETKGGTYTQLVLESVTNALQVRLWAAENLPLDEVMPNIMALSLALAKKVPHGTDPREIIKDSRELRDIWLSEDATLHQEEDAGNKEQV